MNQYKTCSRCNQILDVEYFSYRKAARDKLTSWCRPCMAENAKNRRKANPENARLVNQKAYKKNAERRKEQSSAWKRQNRERSNSYLQSWRAKNKDRARLHNVNNNALRRLRQTSNGIFLVSARELLKMKRSGCVYCGATGFMEIEHIIPLSRGGRHSIGNLAPSCQPCNSQKHDKTVMEWRIWKKRLGLD